MHRKRLAVAVLAVFALVACRAVVGIEDQTVGEAGAPPGPSADGGTEGSSDARTDANQPPTGGGDAGACKSAKKEDCGQCCRMNFGPQFTVLSTEQKANGCVCGVNGVCKAVCNDFCSAVVGTNPGPDCANCLDREQAPNGSNNCQRPMCGTTTCKDILTCISGCQN